MKKLPNLVLILQAIQADPGKGLVKNLVQKCLERWNTATEEKKRHI